MRSLSERPERPVVGVSVPHESAELHVTGAALYTDDLVVRTAGVLHAWPVQAPHAHARVMSLDTSGATTVPGVVRVLTGADVPGVNDAGVKGDEPLFPTEVMYFGHPVAWVLGETLEAARLGAEAVRAEYEVLSSLLTLGEAMEAGSFQGNQPTVSRGDAGAGLAAAAHRFAGELELGGQEHFYLETHAALALVDEAGQVFVQSSTQHPSETQEIVAHVLGLHSHEVTVQCLRMGGGFGGKEMQPHGLAAVAALGSVLTGRPVRLRLNRTQDLTITGKRHPFHASWEAGFDDDGRLLALRATLTSDGGWSLDLSEPVLARALCHIDNAYFIPDVEVHGRIARTNKTSQTAFRGFGGPQGMFVIEDILGRCAPLLGVAPAELRRRNFYAPGQATPYGQPVRHPERLAAIWDEVHQRGDVARRRAAIAAFNAAHPHTKRALAVTPVKFGISFNLTAFNQAGALVHVYKDGSVLINHGGTEMGQGLHTKMRQVAATALGVPLDHVRLAPTRTDKVPNTSATAASSGADLNGGAVKDACEQIRERLAGVAARTLDIHPDDVRFDGGRVTGIGFHDRDLAWADVVRAAYFQRVPLFAAGYYRTEGLHWDSSRMQGEPFKYFSYGAAASEVEVDGFTGAYRFLRTDIVHDVGDTLSPLVDVGQIEGGFVQGAGWLTLEELRWDLSDGDTRGRLATQSASTYKLPSFSEMPEELNVHLFERATETGVVYGSKAVGEPPLMLAFSVREALREAAAAFGPGGVSVGLASPATPEAVFWAVQAARSAGGEAPGEETSAVTGAPVAGTAAAAGPAGTVTDLGDGAPTADAAAPSPGAAQPAATGDVDGSDHGTEQAHDGADHGAGRSAATGEHDGGHDAHGVDGGHGVDGAHGGAAAGAARSVSGGS
ncbi:xanthine dehydrogenase molybdopterin binding subunit [Georgenia muralis]